MRQKEAIYVSDPAAPIGVRTHGRGDERRHLYALRVHSAPAACSGREVELVMTTEEMFRFALRLLGSVSIGDFADPENAALVASLRKVVKIADQVAK